MTLHTHSPNAHGSLDTSQALSPDSVIPTAPSSNTGKLTHVPLSPAPPIPHATSESHHPDGDVSHVASDDPKAVINPKTKSPPCKEKHRQTHMVNTKENRVIFNEKANHELHPTSILSVSTVNHGPPSILARPPHPDSGYEQRPILTASNQLHISTPHPT
ncbi:hypothetical protein AAC387_Pa12g1191 [Persea americana]